MPYSPPSGWIEPYSENPDFETERFHTRTDCPRIRHRDQLRQVDRPYSAARCAGCAEEHGRNREVFAAPPPATAEASPTG